MWGVHTRVPSLPLLGVQRRQTEELVWGRVSCLGLSSSWWPGLPWGLSALREERQQQGFCRLWAGSGSSALPHGYGVFHGEARGASEVWGSPWF